MAKSNSAFMKPMTVSADLAAVVGKGPMPRSEVVKALWVYIKKNGLQDSKNKRNINADEKLKKVFVIMGEPKASLFLSQRIRDYLDIDAVYPEEGREYEL